MSANGNSGHLVSPPADAGVGLVFLTGLGGVLRHLSGQRGPWWRSCCVIGQPFEVLDGGGQQELVPGAGQAPQPEPDHREDLLGFAK